MVIKWKKTRMTKKLAQELMEFENEHSHGRSLQIPGAKDFNPDDPKGPLRFRPWI